MRRPLADGYDADACFELARSLAARGDRACACALLRSALRIDGGHAPTLRALGNLLFDCGHLEGALDYFERFSRMRPG